MPKTTATQTALVRLRDAVLLVAAICLIPLTVLAIIYAISLKHDIVSMRDLNQKLVGIVGQQQQLLEQQRQITDQQLKTNQSQLSIAEQQLEIAKSMFDETQSMNTKLDQSLAIQQKLLGVAQSTLQQAMDINRKMPPPTPLNNLSL
jgi:hypothetical protein